VHQVKTVQNLLSCYGGMIVDVMVIPIFAVEEEDVLEILDVILQSLFHRYPVLGSYEVIESRAIGIREIVDAVKAGVMKPEFREALGVKT